MLLRLRCVATLLVLLLMTATLAIFDAVHHFLLLALRREAERLLLHEVLLHFHFSEGPPAAFGRALRALESFSRCTLILNRRL